METSQLMSGLQESPKVAEKLFYKLYHLYRKGQKLFMIFGGFLLLFSSYFAMFGLYFIGNLSVHTKKMRTLYKLTYR